MIVVGAVWELGWNTPIMEYDLWKYPMKDLGVDQLAFTPISGIKRQDIREFDNVHEMVHHYHLPVVVCTEEGEYFLEDFEHPKNALYLFNRTTGGNFSIVPDYTLKVNTALDRGMLWGHQAASIILYDRLVKSWQ